MEGSYKVKTDVFEGPLEVLLDMIERRKLHISDISLAAIADDFIGYVQTAENFPTAQAASFLFVAATLVLIKSKTLLPTLQLSQEEQGDIADLERRLKIYKRMKELSLHVSERFGTDVIFASAGAKMDTVVFSPHEKITTTNLVSAVKDIVARLPKKIAVPQAVVRKVVSLEEMIDSLIGRVQQSISLSFKDFAGKKRDATPKEEKLHLIVGFLAMLELVKRGVVAVKQEANFDEIFIGPEQAAQT